MLAWPLWPKLTHKYAPVPRRKAGLRAVAAQAVQAALAAMKELPVRRSLAASLPPIVVPRYPRSHSS